MQSAAISAATPVQAGLPVPQAPQGGAAGSVTAGKDQIELSPEARVLADPNPPVVDFSQAGSLGLAHEFTPERVQRLMKLLE